MPCHDIHGALLFLLWCVPAIVPARWQPQQGLPSVALSAPALLTTIAVALIACPPVCAPALVQETDRCRCGLAVQVPALCRKSAVASCLSCTSAAACADPPTLLLSLCEETSGSPNTPPLFLGPVRESANRHQLPQRRPRALRPEHQQQQNHGDGIVTCTHSLPPPTPLLPYPCLVFLGAQRWLLPSMCGLAVHLIRSLMRSLIRSLHMRVCLCAPNSVHTCKP